MISFWTRPADHFHVGIMSTISTADTGLRTTGQFGMSDGFLLALAD